MSYRILIYNQRPLGQFSPTTLLADLKAVHYSTLCRQYGLDVALISPAMDHLAVDGSDEEHVPYFIVRYQSENHMPLVISKVGLADGWLGQVLTEGGQDALSVPVHDYLMRTQEAYSVALRYEQLYDLGLLLAYEIARWVAYRGSGLVFGLDGVWYRLNAQQAFIPAP
jgi:hypothetical protein